MSRSALPTVALALLVGGCGVFAQQTQYSPSGGRASPTVVAACRTRTDEIYARQNRYLLSERDTRDSPFSTQGNTGITSAGLSQRYARDNLYDSCIGSNAPDAGSGAAFSPGQTPTGSSSKP